MIRNETRESAHLRSRVRDLSVVPNIVSYTALLAAITPLAKLTPTTDGLYEPILIRDVDSLIANFGDPKIDPEKYIDLYSIMQLVSNGTSCYVAKVPSGNTGEYDLKLIPINLNELDGAVLTKSNETNSWVVNNLENNIYTVTSVEDSGVASHGSENGLKVEAKSVEHSLDGWKLGLKLTEPHNTLTSNQFSVKVTEDQGATTVPQNVSLLFTLSTFSPGDLGFTEAELCNSLRSINISKQSDKFSINVSFRIQHGESETAVQAVAEELQNLSDLFNSTNKLNIKYNDNTVASFTANWIGIPNGFVLDNTTDAISDITLSSDNLDKIKITVELKDGGDTSKGVQNILLNSDAIAFNGSSITNSDIVSEVECTGTIQLNSFAAPDNTITITLDNYAEVQTWDEVALNANFTQVLAYNDITKKYSLTLSTKEGSSIEPNGDLHVVAYTPVSMVKVTGTGSDTIEIDKLVSDKYAIYKVEKSNDSITEVITNYESKPEFTRNNDGTYNLKINGIIEDESENTSSGKAFGTGTYKITLAPSDTVLHIDSSMADELNIGCKLTQAKPYPLKLFYLEISVATEEGNSLGKAKVKLDENLTNQSLVNTINSSIGAYTRFRLEDTNSSSTNSIVQGLLNKYAPFENGVRKDLENKSTELQSPFVIQNPSFEVQLDKYSETLAQYKDKKYVGCLMADMVCSVTDSVYESDSGDKVKIKYVKELSKAGMDKWPREGSNDTPANVEVVTASGYAPLIPSERRSLHYNMKQIACERKDTTVILSTPYNLGIGVKSDNSGVKTYTYDTTEFTLDEICEWVSATGSFANLWEYGEANQTDYALQSFYLEMYYSWLNMKCTKIDNGLAKSVTVNVAPANLVIENILRSWRERGVQYPVAGDQYGTLPETCTVLKNPKTKLDRDQLVQYRINPIYDTGTRGVQIYGNETLNPGYTDLNAAHIARTLVYIRSTIDEYTERLKFSINSLVLWDTWKSYVSQYILEPLKAANALAEYVVAMGEDTTTAEEIANRTIRGNVSLRFYQSAELFDLTYNIYSSATTLDEAMSNS